MEKKNGEKLALYNSKCLMVNSDHSYNKLGDLHLLNCVMLTGISSTGNDL